MASICIVGGGAIGSLLAWHFAQGRHTVHVIARGSQLEALRGHGLRLERPGGEGGPSGEGRMVELSASDGADLPPQGLIFVTVKAHQLHALLPLLQRLIRPDTVLVPVINGVPWWYFTGHAQYPGRAVAAVDPDGALLSAFGGVRLVGAVAYAMAERTAPGTVMCRGDARLSVGLADPRRPDEEALAQVTALSTPALPIARTDGVRNEIWGKLLGNLSSNPLSVITGAGLRTIYTDPRLLPLVRAVMEEAASIATALGAPPARSPEELLRLGAAAGDFPTSMLQDFRARRPLELAALGDAVLELATLAGVAAPLLASHVALVKFLSAASLPATPHQEVRDV